MPEMQIPFPLKGIPLKPEMTGRVKVDEVVLQTIAALCGWNGEARRLITCALNGSLHTTTPVVKAVLNKVTAGVEHNITFSSTPTTEVMILANPNNAGDVWVNLNAAALVDTGWLLDAGDYLNISINNLSTLRLYTVNIGDKVSIIYTV